MPKQQAMVGNFVSGSGPEAFAGYAGGATGQLYAHKQGSATGQPGPQGAMNVGKKSRQSHQEKPMTQTKMRSSLIYEQHPSEAMGLVHPGQPLGNHLTQDSRSVNPALSGLTQKQGQIYKERKWIHRLIFACRQQEPLRSLAPSFDLEQHFFKFSFICSLPTLLGRRAQNLSDRILQAVQVVQDLPSSHHVRGPQEDRPEEQGVLAAPPEVRRPGPDTTASRPRQRSRIARAITRQQLPLR